MNLICRDCGATFGESEALEDEFTKDWMCPYCFSENIEKEDEQ